MSWEILFGILIAAAAGGWSAIVSVAKSLKVELTALPQDQRDSLVVSRVFKEAVAADVASNPAVAAAASEVLEAAVNLQRAREALSAAVSKANVFADDCVTIGDYGAVTSKPDVTKINSVVRTQAHRATVGESVVGVGKGNGNNRFACDTTYIAPFRGVLSGWSLYVSSDGVATAHRAVSDRESEQYTWKARLNDDGTVSARDAAASIAYAMLVESGKSEVYWGQYGKPAPRPRLSGESMSDYLDMCVDFPPGGGVNVARLWGLKDTVVPT